MKILHTADWHLGKKLEHIHRLPEQIEALDEICQIADDQEVDVVLIAGDLFDNFNPSTDATDLFYKTLSRLSHYGRRPVIAIAGNHDSPQRIEAPNPLAKECGIILAGFPNSEIRPYKLESGLEITKSAPGFIEIQLPNHPPLRLLLTPYASELRLKTYLGHQDSEAELRKVLADTWRTIADKHCDEQGINVLMTHLFFIRKGEKIGENPEPDDEKPILHIGGAQPIHSSCIPAQIQYVALGHIHKYSVVAEEPCPMVYSSSPLAYSFSEAEQTKSVTIIEAQPTTSGKNPAISHTQISLKSGRQLIRKKFQDVPAAVSWLQENPNTLVELILETETYLTAEERRSLYSAHDGIIAIIPLVKNANSSNSQDQNDQKKIDLTKNVKSLFTDYFTHKHGQAPNDEILKILDEII